MVAGGGYIYTCQDPSFKFPRSIFVELKRVIDGREVVTMHVVGNVFSKQSITYTRFVARGAKSRANAFTR
jgi:hypothetical protein